MSLRLPPPKRGPRFGDLVYIGGTGMPIEALPLYQPDAPKAYLVEAPRNVPRCVAWDGLRWADAKLSDEDHGDQEKASDLPQAGSLPASSSDLKEATMTTPAERPAPSRSDPSKPRKIPVHHESTFRAQAKISVAEAGVGSPPRATHRKDVELAPSIQALHDALDKARARRHVDEDAYYAAITAVDQADPLFYRGRHDPLPLIPRHTPPDTIDFARISAEICASLSALEQAA